MLNVRQRAAAAGALTALVAGTMVAVTETSASAAQDTEITSIARSKPIKGEKFRIRGTLRTELARPVKLQRLTKSGWVTIKSGTSTETGRFTFTTATTSKKTYRVRAPKAKIGSRTYIARTTPRRTVSPVSQTARLVVADTSIRAGRDRLVLTAVFTPVRAGREVTLFAQSKGEPVETISGVQNSRGKFRLDAGVVSKNVAAGTFAVWARTEAANGAPSKTSKKVTVTIVK